LVMLKMMFFVVYHEAPGCHEQAMSHMAAFFCSSGRLRSLALGFFLFFPLSQKIILLVNHAENALLCQAFVFRPTPSAAAGKTWDDDAGLRGQHEEQRPKRRHAQIQRALCAHS
jgi:hypothetical protein